MEKLKEKLLARIRPEGLSESHGKWQQQKAAETRLRILEATVDCLVEKGYSRLSTNEVIQRAGISRGAMHHYFQTRMDLVAAVSEFTFYVRMERFLEAYFAAIEEHSDSAVVQIATEKYWDSVQTREYAAYLELAIAARTDAELNSHFLPDAQRFDHVWSEEMNKSFPQWREHWDALQIASDFTMAACMGLLLYKPVFGDGGRVDNVKNLIMQTVLSLHAERGLNQKESSS